MSTGYLQPACQAFMGYYTVRYGTLCNAFEWYTTSHLHFVVMQSSLYLGECACKKIQVTGGIYRCILRVSVDYFKLWMLCRVALNTNGRTESVHFKCYVKPMKDPLGVRPSKGNQGTTRGKEKNSFDLGGNRTHDLRIRSTVTLPTELRGRTEKVGDDSGGESRQRESKGAYECCAA